MTGRLIDAYKLAEHITDMSTDYWTTNYGIPVSALEDAPTVEAEPVRHGKWKPFDEVDEDEYTCSECGNLFVTLDGEHPLSNGFKYCPFCGAKMEEE